MKKVLLLCVGVAFVASMTSCKKNYTCKCTYSGTESTYPIKATKKDAESTCSALEVGGESCTLTKD